MAVMTSVVDAIAQRSLASHPKKDGDWTDQNGILRCGACGEPKRMRQAFSYPTADDPDNTKELLVGVMCRCAKQKAAQAAADDKARKELELVSSLRKASLMSEKFSGASLASFRTTKDNEKNFKLCRRYVSAWEKMLESNQGLLFWGDVGTGKSYAAACIANELMAKRVSVVMTSFVKLLELVRKSGESETTFINRLCKAKLVIFDDLGAERDSDYALEKVYNIIDSRYRSGLPMIITTNLDIQVMKEEADIRLSRIYDRIFETCYPSQFTGVSWRRRSASKRFREMESLLSMDE